MQKRQNDSDAPFYISHHKYKTSAEIINEARAGISQNNMSENISVLSGSSGAPRTLGTQRPFTPRERQRTLFGKVNRSSRPPSAVNLKYLQHQSNESLRNSIFSNKKSQLVSSFDDRILLDDIDEKPEFNARKRKEELSLKVKSLNTELDFESLSQINSGSKLRLPSLNGLPKPLHQRKNLSRSTFLSQSLTDEKEDVQISAVLPASTDYLKKSNATSQSYENVSTSQNIISLDVFNKRRLFGDYKSKSEDVNDAKLSSQIYKPPVEERNEVKSYGNKFSTAVKQDNLDLNKIKSPVVSNLLDNLSSQESLLLSDEDIIEMLSILYTTIEKEIPWQNINSDEKAAILKVLYKYIESSNERLLISIARIILALRVTGSNLSGVCKLIFKVARNDKNDHLFLNDNLLELFIIGLSRAEPLNDAECLVYGYGALKFLGMNLIILEKMRPLGVLPLMTLHLKMYNEARRENIQSVGEQGCHGLYQLTGALRNMAGGDVMWNGIPIDNSSGTSTPCNNLIDFISGGTLAELSKTLGLFTEDLDVEINVSRTLSVLSADYECCVSLCHQNNIITFIINLLQIYTEKPPLIVRLTYIIGNMVACNNEIRQELYNEPKAMSALLKILETYLKQNWSCGKMESAENIIIGSDLDGSNGSDEDVMVKTIRVIANMCLNPTVGTQLIEVNGFGEKILTWILKCLRQYAPTECVELAVSSLAALNNISYYHIGEQVIVTAFSGLQIPFCEALCRLLSQGVSSWITEAIRVLGNMSRSKITRDYIVETGALLDIIKLTKCDDIEASLAATGVLVNMAADENARQVWINTGGIREAAHALQNAAVNHQWQLAHLLCQALWNATPLPHSDTLLLAPLLLDILDEQHIFGDMDTLNTTFMELNLENEKSILQDYTATHLAWEEFAVVAVNLLDKIDPAVEYNCEDDEENSYKVQTTLKSDLIPI